MTPLPGSVVTVTDAQKALRRSVGWMLGAPRDDDLRDIEERRAAHNALVKRKVCVQLTWMIGAPLVAGLLAWAIQWACR